MCTYHICVIQNKATATIVALTSAPTSLWNTEYTRYTKCGFWQKNAFEIILKTCHLQQTYRGFNQGSHEAASLLTLVREKSAYTQSHELCYPGMLLLYEAFTCAGQRQSNSSRIQRPVRLYGFECTCIRPHTGYYAVKVSVSVLIRLGVEV